MGKYLTEFSSNTEYNAALATLDYPNVSLVANELKYAESLPTMYRWVDDGDNTRCGDDSEHEGEWRDGCTLYQQTKKQMSIDGGQTWSDVVPAEYGYGEFIEEDSSECGCGEGGEGCEWDWMDVNDYNYNSMAVMDIRFDNPDNGTWEAWYQNGTVYSFYINGNCDDAGCPVLKLEARMRYDDGDDTRYYVEVNVYGGCDCFDGECPTLLDTQELDDGTSLNLYQYYDRSGIDDLHYDGSNSIPSLKLNVAEGGCIDQC